MELLPFEFVHVANQAGLSQEEIQELIGKEMSGLQAAEEEDLSWRQLPEYSDLSENLKLLQQGETSLLFQKIARREVIQSYKFFASPSLRSISLLGNTPNHTLRFEAFSNFDSFGKFAAGTFQDFPALPSDIPALRQMTRAEFTVFALLVELFIRQYPDPDINWEPEEALTFEAADLLDLARTAEEQDEDSTWWLHFNRLEKLAPVSLADIQTGIAILATKELIGLSDDVVTIDRYFLGENLTWFIRSLAWWDRGFSVVHAANGTQFIMLQASALFIITIEKGMHFGIANTSGNAVPDLLRKYLKLSLDTKKEIPSPKSESTKQTPNFCQNCGAKLIPNAKFCMNCGAKVH